MMTSAGIVSFHHPDSLLSFRNRPFLFTWPSAKLHSQMKMKMYFSLTQVLGASHQASGPFNRCINCATASQNHNQRFSSDDEYYQKPFWLTVIGDITRSLRFLVFFLIEQPSQLKYIEWPTIESTAKTATLTLLLVALLIVALATVDSFLFYILALLSRKSA